MIRLEADRTFPLSSRRVPGFVRTMTRNCRQPSVRRISLGKCWRPSASSMPQIGGQAKPSISKWMHRVTRRGTPPTRRAERAWHDAAQSHSPQVFLWRPTLIPHRHSRAATVRALPSVAVEETPGAGLDHRNPLHSTVLAAEVRPIVTHNLHDLG